MRRYDWHAIQDDGSLVPRWLADGAENRPDPWRTRQFHLFPVVAGSLAVVSIFVPKGARLRYARRGHVDAVEVNGEIVQSAVRDTIYVVGWEHPDQEISSYTFVLPDGRIEQAPDWNHITRYERELESLPLSRYERLGAQPAGPSDMGIFGPPAGEVWFDFLIDAEVVDLEPGRAA